MVEYPAGQRLEPSAMIGRVQRSGDFERVLRAPIRSRTHHFALHHLAQRPSAFVAKPLKGDLSTGARSAQAALVDETPPTDPRASLPDKLWWGMVVPKRHARRSVTRSLIKRQIRSCAAGVGATLAGGLWVVRLRAPFDPKAFPSAASDALKHAARAELLLLLGQAARG